MAEYLSLQEIEEQSNDICNMSGDPEIMHLEEDTLHEKVLRGIAAGFYSESEAKEAARLALITRDADLERWYA